MSSRHQGVIKRHRGTELSYLVSDVSQISSIPSTINNITANWNVQCFDCLLLMHRWSWMSDINSSTNYLFLRFHTCPWCQDLVIWEICIAAQNIKMLVWHCNAKILALHVDVLRENRVSPRKSGTKEKKTAYQCIGDWEGRLFAVSCSNSERLPSVYTLPPVATVGSTAQYHTFLIHYQWPLNTYILS